MTFKNLNPILGAPNGNVGICFGTVDLDGYGEIVSASSIKGITVTHPTSGVYTFTVRNPGISILTAHCTVKAATAVDLVPQCSSLSASAATFKLLAGATATEPSAACSLMVTIVSSESRQ